MTFLLAAVFVVLMFVAMSNISAMMSKIDEGYALHPLCKATWENTIIAVGCLFLAFFLPMGAAVGAQSETEIEARLNSTFEILLRELPKMESKNDAKEFISRHLLPITDTRKTAQLMLGKHWRKASEGQRTRFTKAMTANLINTYAAVLLDENASRAKFNIIRITTSTSAKGSKYKVVATVTIDQPIDIGFTILERKGKDWKLVDATVEGISMVQNWRSTFNELLQNKSLDDVITDVENNNVKTKE